MPSENYDFVPWDSPDDIHKFFNFDDIEKWAPLVGLLTRVGAQGAANAVATQGVRGAMKTGLGKLGTGLKVALGGGLKNIKAKVGVKGGGAATEAAGAAEGMASAAEAVESAAPKPSLPKASDGTDSVPLPESPAAEPAAEIPEPEEPSGAGGNKTDYKKVGMQLAGQMQAQNAQRKQAQEQRAMEMARRGASVQTGEPMNLAWRLLKEEDDEVPDPRKFKMPQEDYVEALRERAKRIKGRQADPNMAENTENVPMGLKEKVPFTQPPGGGPIQLPTKLTPPNASQGIQRRVHPFTREGTFEGLSLDTPDADPKKYFTRSEPMGIAYQLLKEQIDYENQMELAPHEQLWNDEADEHLKTKTNELFDYAIAQGIDPGDLLDAWHDRASMVEGLDYGEPGSELGFRAHAVDPSQWKKLASEPMDLAWQLLKMPVVDTAAGVPVAYGGDVYYDEDARARGIIGQVPYHTTPKDGPVDMTPNQYFDRLMNPEYKWNVVGTAEAPYRWLGNTGYGEEFDKKHIQSMLEGLQSGQIMAAPQLWFGESSEEEPWGQEGGHRMETLRQMGHGDTPIPVWHRYTR